MRVVFAGWTSVEGGARAPEPGRRGRSRTPVPSPVGSTGNSPGGSHTRCATQGVPHEGSGRDDLLGGDGAVPHHPAADDVMIDRDHHLERPHLQVVLPKPNMLLRAGPLQKRARQETPGERTWKSCGSQNFGIHSVALGWSPRRSRPSDHTEPLPTSCCAGMVIHHSLITDPCLHIRGLDQLTEG